VLICCLLGSSVNRRKQPGYSVPDILEPNKNRFFWLPVLSVSFGSGFRFFRFGSRFSVFFVPRATFDIEMMDTCHRSHEVCPGWLDGAWWRVVERRVRERDVSAAERLTEIEVEEVKYRSKIDGPDISGPRPLSCQCAMQAVLP
jgi:hypothetical protein